MLSGVFYLALVTTSMVYCEPVPETNEMCMAAAQKEALVQLGDCGISAQSSVLRRKKRVVGGRVASDGDWPWMAALFDYDEYFCGGSLISNQHVLTAHHCVNKLKAEDITVRLGAHDLTQSGEGAINVTVEEILLHSGYSRNSRENNIAILRLTAPIQPSDFIRPICLPSGLLQPGQVAFVAGWGATQNGGPHTETLMETRLPIWRSDLCRQALQQNITAGLVCAGWKGGEKDACTKDGGSPLMIQAESGSWEVAGIVIFGRGCARPNTPGVYTRVSSYTEWIKNRIKIHSATIPFQKSCGRPSVVSNGIISGREAEPGQWPWMASLLLKDDSEHFCGGVLVTDRHILTATNCLRDLKLGEIIVRLGEHNLEVTNGTEKDFEVDRICTHANYSYRLLKNDIAILRLKEKVNFSEMIQPVCLPLTEIDLNNTRTYVIGWGQTSFYGTPNPVLLQSPLSVWSLNRCQEIYPRFDIGTNQVCAGHKYSNRDSCRGDSGGPLLYKVNNERWFVVGVVSGGLGCADGNKPGIYTRVSSYADWIKGIILNNYGP